VIRENRFVYLRFTIHDLRGVKMADPNDRVEENVLGAYYVDTQCIDCDVCRDTAPDNFTRSDENGYSFVFKQPENEEERALCDEALSACPVEAIGSDG
jgi:ferredoxin